jgi:hypothetical protein
MEPLDGIRTICLALPEVTGRPSHARPPVRPGQERLRDAARRRPSRQPRFPHLWCAAPSGAQEELTAVGRPAFFRPAYGRSRLAGVRLDGDLDWTEVAELCLDAYRVVAPKRLVALLDATP